MFRRLLGRSKKKPEEEPSAGKESVDTSIPAVEPEAVEEGTKPTSPFSEVAAEKTPVTFTMGHAVIPHEVDIDAEKTADLARRASITPQTAAEIVPGKVLKRDAEGRVHIKIVFYGPSLSGKTTALRWLFGNIRSLSKGKIVEISDELGRTTFFDFVPVTASENMVFDVFTVAGQRRHASSRIKVLRDCDGIIFMADSTPEQMNENLASIQELRIALGTDRMATLPIICSLNKRDIPNALPIDYMVQMLDLEGYPVFDTIAIEGKNLLRMFQRVLRDSLIFKIGI
ncbi:MAG: GTPase domain-containing protein [Candidatus Thorarchaeota archaeon]|nr:GTPase domain-containing protein [Candidatus Thorarchaeota archaeon]